jgi:hypothetical protein
LLDHESINELKKVKLAYELNSNNPYAAAQYANQLTLVMKLIYDRQNGTYEELAAYKTLLHPLTEAYRRHPDFEMVAVNYLFGISYISEQLDENIGGEMAEIAGRFRNNEHAQNFCYMGLYHLIAAHVARKDTAKAERDIKYFETLYSRNSTNEEMAGTYAIALMAVASIQDFFQGRKTVAKLQKLAKQYPYNRKITGAYENMRKMFRTGNFFLLLDNKNKYETPNESAARFDDTKSMKSSILKAISELFTEALAGYGEGIYDDYGNNYDYYNDHDDSECDDDD